MLGTVRTSGGADAATLCPVVPRTPAAPEVVSPARSGKGERQPGHCAGCRGRTRLRWLLLPRGHAVLLHEREQRLLHSRVRGAFLPPRGAAARLDLRKRQTLWPPGGDGQSASRSESCAVHERTPWNVRARPASGGPRRGASGTRAAGYGATFGRRQVATAATPRRAAHARLWRRACPTHLWQLAQVVAHHLGGELRSNGLHLAHSTAPSLAPRSLTVRQCRLGWLTRYPAL